MKKGLNNEFYCSSSGMEDCPEKGNCMESGCPDYHRKFPTVKQYKQEYGEDVPDNMPVWILFIGAAWMNDEAKEWVITTYSSPNFIDLPQGSRDRYIRPLDIAKVHAIVVACTPFCNKPDSNWRPKYDQ
jgi:hypothetical protein